MYATRSQQELNLSDQVIYMKDGQIDVRKQEGIYESKEMMLANTSQIALIPDQISQFKVDLKHPPLSLIVERQ
jgi:ABC-type Fe3+/spermidine/putrescine transport system ATPase subunit